MFGIPRKGECDYTTVLELNLAEVAPAVAGPKRPQDRIVLPDLKEKFRELFQKPFSENVYNKPASELENKFPVEIGVKEKIETPVMGGGKQDSPVPKQTDTSVWTETEMVNNRPTPDAVLEVRPEEFPRASAEIAHGSVLISAITSCTNTSNPSVMIAAGLLAKKAVEKGLGVSPLVKTSLAPGSRVVSE